MNVLILDVGKSNVFDEVAKLTAYVGAKNKTEQGVNIYDQVFTTDDDIMLLERFFREAKVGITELLKPFIMEISQSTDDVSVDMKEHYRVTLNMPGSYPLVLKDALAGFIFSYFVNSIVSKWFAITNKADAEYYTFWANNNLNEAQKNIYYRGKPQKSI